MTLWRQWGVPPVQQSDMMLQEVTSWPRPRPDNRREYGTIPADCGPEDLSIPGYHLNGSMLRFRAPQDPGIRGKGKKKEGGEKREGKKRGKRGGLGDHICLAGLKLRTNVYKELRKEKKKKKERKREREGRKKRGEKEKKKGEGGEGGRRKRKEREREKRKRNAKLLFFVASTGAMFPVLLLVRKRGGRGRGGGKKGGKGGKKGGKRGGGEERLNYVKNQFFKLFIPM